MSTSPDRPVLITGCSSGIGRCAALGLAQRGYRVFATVRQDRDVESLTQLGLDTRRLDLAAPASIEQAVGDILDRTDGKLYALINNGAYGQPGAVEDLSSEALRAQFDINLFGTHELTARLIPVFRRANQGRIIQISSILGLVCLPFRGAYNASKYALEALSDTMRLELRDTHIHISLIEPGPIDSRFRDNALQHYHTHIDPDRSVHREAYRRVEQRLQSKGGVQFTLPAEAVLDKILHALESPRPRVRYPVTVPAHLMSRFKRWLPDRWLDRLILRFGDG